MWDTFELRDARLSDKREVLAFTANTWQTGDYIDQVFDDWLADRTGRFVVLEERATGMIAAIDKLTFLSASEAWFEGLRVNPAFRGHGLATQLEAFMIGEARRLGASTLRFMTLMNNLTVHKMAFRHGFCRLFTVAHATWRPEGHPREEYRGCRMRNAAVAEAGPLFSWWERACGKATHNLMAGQWTFSTGSFARWEEGARSRALLTLATDDASLAVLPPPTVLFEPVVSVSGEQEWHISAMIALDSEWLRLAQALTYTGASRNVSQIRGLIPEREPVLAALREAGFQIGSEDRYAIFELKLDDIDISSDD